MKLKVYYLVPAYYTFHTHLRVSFNGGKELDLTDKTNISNLEIEPGEYDLKLKDNKNFTFETPFTFSEKDDGKTFLIIRTFFSFRLKIVDEKDLLSEIDRQDKKSHPSVRKAKKLKEVKDNPDLIDKTSMFEI